MTDSETVDRKEMKITVKIFLSNTDSESLKEAIDQSKKRYFAIYNFQPMLKFNFFYSV